MKISLIGPTFDASGYAEAMRAFLTCMEDVSDVRLIPKDWNQLGAGLPLHETERLKKKCHLRVYDQGPIFQIMEAKDFQPVPGRFNIGVTMLETDRLPQTWVRQCNKMDEIWVPSSFNLRTFSRSGVDSAKLRVVPVGVDDERFHPDRKPLITDISPDTFVFVSNFEWVPRKGYDLLLRAYLEEFRSTDPVMMIVKTYDGSQYDPEGRRMRLYWEKLIDKHDVNRPPPIRFLPYGLRFENMASFYTTGDCYIIPTRGEGWNLPALEAMASGLSVITTRWSAHLDFLNKHNSVLIPIEGLEPVPEFGISNDAIYRGSYWAIPSYPHIRRWMRFAVDHPQLMKRKGRWARRDVTNYWNRKKMKERILSILIEKGEPF